MTLLKSYKQLPLDLARGEDVYVWDTAGKRYLDLYAGHAVCATGHCHPHVVKAIQEQAATNGSRLRQTERVALTAEMLYS